MSVIFYRRCITFYYRNPISRLIDPYFTHLNPISKHISTFSVNSEDKSVNLSYQKVSDCDVEFSDEDEFLFPENFDNLENVSLNRLISFRNNLNKSEKGSENPEDLSSLVKSKLTESELRARNEQISKFFEKILREKVNKKCSVSFFGSAINGLWTDGSDLDVCVQIPNVNSRSAIIRNLRRISNVFAPISPSRVFQNRFTAKIPILHWKLNHSKIPNSTSYKQIYDVDFECDDIPSIDISVNNDLAVVNSMLIGSYVSFEPRVRDLVLFLKIWARNKNINNRSEGTLSSFAISLMVIHFLQSCNPPILPSIQDLALSTNENPNYISGVDCRFSTDLHKIGSELAFLTKGKKNNSDNRTLLTEFFRYYGWYNVHSKNKPILIRSVDPSEIELENSGLNEPFLHVDNPFEVGIDVANIAIHQRSKITSEFKRAYHLLKCGNTLSSLLYT